MAHGQQMVHSRLPRSDNAHGTRIKLNIAWAGIKVDFCQLRHLYACSYRRCTRYLVKLTTNLQVAVHGTLKNTKI
jgi:hypothetical protein